MDNAMRLLIFLVYSLCVQATSTPVATSTLVSVYTITSYYTRSSVTGSSTSTIGGTGDPSCTTSIVSSKTQVACVDDPIAITLVTLYGTSVSISLLTSTATIGYSTIYSSIPDAATTSPSTSAIPSSTPGTSTPTSTPVVQSSSTITSVFTSDGITSTSIVTSPVTATSSSSSSSSTAESASSSTAASSSDGLSTGLKAAIAVAVVLGAVLAIVLAVFLIKRRQKKRKQLAESTPDFSTGAAVGHHELNGETSNDHAAMAIAAANGNEKMPVYQAYEKHGQALNEAPWQGQRFYEDHRPQTQRTYGEAMYESGGNVRYEMGADRRLHEMDGTGRRV